MELQEESLQRNTGAIALLSSSYQLKKNEVWMISLTHQEGKLSTKIVCGDMKVVNERFRDTGGTLLTARRLRVGANTTNVFGALGPADRADFFRVDLTAPRSSFRASLTGMPAGVNYNLILSRVVGPARGVQRLVAVATSQNPGNSPEAINRNLARGSYVVQVQRVSDTRRRKVPVNVNYTLALSAPLDRIGDTFETAQGVAVNPFLANALPGGVATEVLGAVDRNNPTPRDPDFYTFNITERVNYEVTVNSLARGATTQLNLFDAFRNPIASSPAVATGTPQKLTATLNPGRYFLSVVGASTVPTPYSIAMQAPEVPDGGGNSFEAASQKEINFFTTTFDDFLNDNDPVDIYKFNPETPGQLNITLSNLTANADLEIYRDIPGIGPQLVTFQSNSGNGNEQISLDLGESDIVDGNAPALYYLVVRRPEPGTSTPYTLRATLAPEDRVPNTADQARPLDLSTPAPVEFTDFIGGDDTADWFKFEVTDLANASYLEAELTGMRGSRGNLNLQLYRVDENGALRLRSTSDYAGTANEGLKGRLSRLGTYYLRVYPGESGAFSRYTLKASLKSAADVAVITRDVNPFGDASAQQLTSLNGVLFYVASDGTQDTNGNILQSLWRSEGTLDTTDKLATFTNISNLAAVGGRLLFTADNGTSGTELWKWEITAAQPVTGEVSLVKDVVPGAGSSLPLDLTVVGNYVYFRGSVDGGADPSSQRLFRSDGTTAGTVVIGGSGQTNNAGRLPRELVVAGNDVFYLAGSDEGPTVYRIANATNPDASQLNPTQLTNFGSAEEVLSPKNLQVVANQDKNGNGQEDDGFSLLFVSQIRVNGAIDSRNVLRRIDLADPTNLISYDSGGVTVQGSGSSFSLVSVKVPDGNSFKRYVYFTAENQDSGEELFRLDLAGNATPELVSNIAPLGAPSIPRSLKVVGNMIFFTAENTETITTQDGTVYRGIGRELWMTDPSKSLNDSTATVSIDIDAGPTGNTPNPDGTLPQRPSSADPSNLTAIGNLLYFTATTTAQGEELWRYDMAAPTDKLTQLANLRTGDQSSEPDNLVDVDGILYFVANDGDRGREVWSLAGTRRNPAPQ